MKVSKCSENKAPAIPATPTRLRFEDISKKEGVYTMYYSGLKGPQRFLVLKYGDTSVVLYYGNNTLQPANTSVWDAPNYTYELDTTAEVCFEIRSKA